MHSDFRILRLLDNELTSSDCHLEIEMQLNPDSDLDVAKTKIKAMKFWLQCFVHDCVAYNVHTNLNTSLLEEISNNIMMCPDDPHDYLLLTLLHSKLIAIGGDDILIKSTTLFADTGDGFSHTLAGLNDDFLPSIDEWIGKRRFFEQPWWNREDSSTIDLMPQDDEDLTILPKLGENLYEMVADLPKNTAVDNSQTAEIIKPMFKPQIIDGQD